MVILLLIVHFSQTSIAFFSCSHVSPVIDISSAYPKQSTPIFSSSSNISSNAHKNSSGLATPPYIIPFSIPQDLFPTLISVYKYSQAIVFINSSLTPLSLNFYSIIS